MTPRPPKHPDIIYRPELQPRAQRTAFRGLTVAAWALWFYLFLPLLSLMAWWLGAEMFGDYMLDPTGRSYLFTLSAYAAVVAMAALVIVGWSRYNQWRFQGNDKRKSAPPVTDAMVCERFGIGLEDLHRIHRSKIVVLVLDEQGLITGVDRRN